MQVLVLQALTNPGDYGVLESLKEEWENVPPSWRGTDACGYPWEGIECNNSRVVTMWNSNNVCSTLRPLKEKLQRTLLEFKLISDEKILTICVKEAHPWKSNCEAEEEEEERK
ncbi:hypothetical protein A4A49_24257 [Nicotiana attenuata]|uniref:Leucine-rich repeat-containing N-terminal plant-type domain-containing protein n=1 Tax=Nicotiana attenuata TaxID=49451 RepID=A0A314L2E6_NICAT|nr:hypothetical protein A4A49_24257 [Nicotiana attenuata]